MTSHILLLGTDFLNPIGDKNIWFNMLPYLIKEFDSISVISVSVRKNEVEWQDINGRRIYIHNCRPVVRPGPNVEEYANTLGMGRRTRYQNELMRTSALLRMVALIRRINSTSKLTHVHFLNHFGPFSIFPRPFLPDMAYTLSVMGYIGSHPFRDLFLRPTYQSFNMIAVTSQEHKVLLGNFGIEPERIRVIRWGVPEMLRVSDAEKRELKEKFGIPKDSVVFLWSGFIMQIREREFYATIQYVKEIAPRLKNAYFIFSFKPEFYREQYRQWENERIRIIYNPHQFHSILRMSDALFSPIVSRDAIVTPPLTWLESMALGIPIITTMAGGVTEVISHGLDGVIAQDFSQLEEVIGRFIQDPTLRSKMSVACQKKILEKFNVKSTAEGYIKMWKECDAL